MLSIPLDQSSVFVIKLTILQFIPKIIWTKLFSHYYNNFSIGHFDIEKTCKLLAQKYYKPNFCHNIKIYVKRPTY